MAMEKEDAPERKWKIGFFLVKTISQKWRKKALGFLIFVILLHASAQILRHIAATFAQDEPGTKLAL
jgi:hypothetical protein